MTATPAPISTTNPAATKGSTAGKSASRRRASNASTTTTDTSRCASDQAAAEPLAPQSQAVPTQLEPTSSCATAAALAARIPLAAALPLPDLDQPAFSPQQPAASYKLAFSDTSRWYCSRDGGHTSEPTASAAIAGAVIDLALQISPAQQRDGDDYRLRLAFIERSGELAELNLNAVSTNPDGSSYITSPARSLAGALLAISDSEDDMRAFYEGARFSIRKGNGRGVFVETDIAVSGRWLAMSGALATLRVAKDPHTFCQQITAIKERFRSCGLLLNGPAVLHSCPPDPDSAPLQPVGVQA